MSSRDFKKWRARDMLWKGMYLQVGKMCLGANSKRVDVA